MSSDLSSLLLPAKDDQSEHIFPSHPERAVISGPVTVRLGPHLGVYMWILLSTNTGTSNLSEKKGICHATFSTDYSHA